MAKLLVFDRDNVHADEEKDYRGSYKKGYIVETFPDSKPHVDPPQEPFLILQITDRTKEQADEYMQSWQRAVDYSVVNRDVPSDGWRLDLTATNPNASGKGHLTVEKVRNYLESWGAQNISLNGNSVRFDITIVWILQSRRYWGSNVSLLVFNELSYDQGTGVHRMEVNYGAVPYPPNTSIADFEKRFSDAVEEKGGAVVSNGFGVIVFDIGRDVVIQRMRDVVQREVQETICLRQKYFDPAFADQIIAAGRVLVTDAATVAPWVRDRLTE